MMSREEARLVAERFLDAEVRDRFEFDVVIVERSVKDLGDMWVFPYDGRAYVEADDWHEAMAGNMPVMVDKATGLPSFAE
jgi:hypothetical protein